MISRSKTSLFLIELVIMILLFSLSAAVCLRIFASAQSASDYSRNLSSACMNAQSRQPNAIKLPEGIWSDARKFCMDLKTRTTVTVYYDNKWKNGF